MAGQDITVVDVFEAVGALTAGKITPNKLQEYEQAACPTVGACPGMYSAGTMSAVSEVMGLAPPNSAFMPAVHTRRLAMAEQAGHDLMRMVRDKVRPRDIVSRKSFENAAALVAASGGSTNAALLSSENQSGTAPLTTCRSLLRNSTSGSFLITSRTSIVSLRP